MTAIPPNRYQELRGDYPHHLPADIPIRLIICSGLTNQRNPPPDELVGIGLRTVMDRVYGNFIDTTWRRTEGVVTSNANMNFLTEGCPYFEYAFNLPTPTSWTQLDNLEIQIANMCDWFLDNEYTVWPYIRWRDVDRILDPAILLT